MEQLSDGKNKEKYRLCVELIKVAKEVNELMNGKEIVFTCEIPDNLPLDKIQA